MKKIALEGPINKCADNECQDWRNEVITKLNHKYTFHNPMDFDCRGKEASLERELVNYDTAGIASSDVVLVMANKPGWGTAMAVQMAWNWHKFVVTVCPDGRPSPWLNNRSSSIFKTLEDAINFLETAYG